ncbi:HAD-IA family hydrolase [Candidatus Dependentiae bacterium]|nr:HAD-IA family hydrolase [Candidatus Dependentiae bacterium]
MKYRCKVFLILTIACSSTIFSMEKRDRIGSSISRPTTLIWDLGGVLTENSWSKYISYIGISKVLFHMVWDWRLPHHTCKARTFEVLDQVPVPQEMIFKGACIGDGTAMPAIMGAYQAGLLQREQVLPLLQETIERLEKDSFFRSSYEKALIESIIDHMFNPETLVSCNYILSDGLSMVQAVAEQKNDDGSNIYAQYVLSNWDFESFQLMGDRFNSLFSYFKGIVISGAIGTIKPMQEAFKQIIETYALTKADCVFIDDRKENIEAALSYGIGHAVHFVSYEKLREDLNALGITGI